MSARRAVCSCRTQIDFGSVLTTVSGNVTDAVTVGVTGMRRLRFICVLSNLIVCTRTRTSGVAVRSAPPLHANTACVSSTRTTSGLPVCCSSYKCLTTGQLVIDTQTHTDTWRHLACSGSCCYAVVSCELKNLTDTRPAGRPATMSHVEMP